VFTAEYHHHSSLKLIVSDYFETSNVCQPSHFTPLKVAGNLRSQSLVRLISHNIQRCSVPWDVRHLFLAEKKWWAYKMELWCLAAL